MVTRIDKAIVAFILAAGGVLGTGQLNGDSGTTTVVEAIVVGLVAALGVWAAPNKAA